MSCGPSPLAWLAPYFLTLSGVALFVAVYQMVRLPIVKRIRERAMSICARRASAAGEGRRFKSFEEIDSVIREAWAPYERGPSFGACIWSVTKWRFKDFYPTLDDVPNSR